MLTFVMLIAQRLKGSRFETACLAAATEFLEWPPDFILVYARTLIVATPLRHAILLPIS